MNRTLSAKSIHQTYPVISYYWKSDLMFWQKQIDKIGSLSLLDSNEKETLKLSSKTIARGVN